MSTTDGRSVEPSEPFAWPIYPDLAGKVAIVTGGSRGLGAMTSRAFAANGIKVAVNGRDSSAIDSVVREIIEAGGAAIPAPADCTDPAALEMMRARVEGQFGPVQVLAAFAGGGRQPQPFNEIDNDEWRADLEENLSATFFTVKTFLPGMTKRREGSILTMASVAARIPGGAPIAYAAAKAGVIVLTQQIAKEVGPHHVRVNCLAPSTVLNERMDQAIPEEKKQQMSAMYPLGRLGVPADVAHASLFFASEASSWITGVTLDIAGGQVMT
jgi:3-oxoacyl-[acyl-carrier protein] reductase